LSKLVAAEYLTGTRLPSSSGQGSGPILLTIGPMGRRALAESLGVSESSFGRRSRARAPLFLHHHLAISDVRLAFELATAASGVFAHADWTPEWRLRSQPVRVSDPVTGPKTVLVPDGALTLSLADGGEQEFLIEVDMGTITNPQRVRTKLRGYLLRHAGHSQPVLWVVPDERRGQTLTDCAISEAHKLSADATMFFVAQRATLDQQTILDGEVWDVADGPSRVSLVSLAGGND